MPTPSLQLKEKTSRMQGSRELVTELWFPRFVTIQWLCSQLCYVTAGNPWTIVEIELLATVGWKCGCQPFSCRCTQNVTNCRKEICSTCLLWIPFGSSLHPVRTRSSWKAKYHQLCVIAASCPSLRCSCRKRPVSGREAEGFVTELWFPRFVWNALIVQLCYETVANEWTIVEIELLATVGWKCGCQPISCPCWQNVTHWRKQICSTCLFKESIPAIPF